MAVHFLKMLRFYFNKRIIIGCTLALALLSWLAYLSFQNKKKMIASSELVAHTFDVLYNTERVLTSATGIELGQRGFTITGNEEFLITFNKSRDAILKHIDTLRSLTRDNSAQQEKILLLEKNIHQLISFSSRAIDERKKEFELAQKINSSMEGRRTLEVVRTILYDIQREENILLTERSRKNHEQIAQFNFTFISLLLATTLVLLIVFFAINTSMKARVDTEKQLSAALSEVRDLYDNAPCGYHSIDANGFFVNVNNTLCTWLGYSKEEMIGKLKFTDVIVIEDPERSFESFEKFKVTGVVNNLEFNFRRKDQTDFPVVLSSVAVKSKDGRFLRSRSITMDNIERKRGENQVKNLNRELEAFTYSVSHDLRAPLRSIDGYSRILQEDYEEKLDDEGKRVIQVIMNNAKRMGRLIDDLLDFARLGRKELVRSQVDMNILVESIVREFKEQHADRKITFNIKPLQSSSVDVDMIRQVWTNLISNAVKFSSKKEHSQIEISSKDEGEEISYSVTDNGVGFDMQYVSKLFGVFQRLHKIQDFAGTGVGLAMVKRIINRHDGKVWAEAKIDDGATFYFTIPKS